MRLTGRLLQVDYNDGTFRDRDTGQDVAWSNATLHVLDGVVIHKCKVKADDFGKIAHLNGGDEIDLRVGVVANAGARGAYLTITFVSEWAPIKAAKAS